MNLETALSKIHAPKGMTSMIAGVMSGDFDPIRGPEKPAGRMSVKDAGLRLAKAEQDQRNCQSDWAWWGYQGDVSYWKAVVDILKAADITGDDALPDLEFGDAGVVVMDQCSKVEKFGREILRLARITEAP